MTLLAQHAQPPIRHRCPQPPARHQGVWSSQDAAALREKLDTMLLSVHLWSDRTQCDSEAKGKTAQTQCQTASGVDFGRVTAR